MNYPSQKKAKKRGELSKKTVFKLQFQKTVTVHLAPFVLLLLLILLMEAGIHLPFHYPCRPNHTCCQWRQLLQEVPINLSLCDLVLH